MSLGLRARTSYAPVLWSSRADRTGQTETNSRDWGQATKDKGARCEVQKGWGKMVRDEKESEKKREKVGRHPREIPSEKPGTTQGEII